MCFSTTKYLASHNLDNRLLFFQVKGPYQDSFVTTVDLSSKKKYTNDHCRRTVMNHLKVKELKFLRDHSMC